MTARRPCLPAVQRRALAAALCFVPCLALAQSDRRERLAQRAGVGAHRLRDHHPARRRAFGPGRPELPGRGAARAVPGAGGVRRGQRPARRLLHHRRRSRAVHAAGRAAEPAGRAVRGRWRRRGRAGGRRADVAALCQSAVGLRPLPCRRVGVERQLPQWRHRQQPGRRGVRYADELQLPAGGQRHAGAPGQPCAPAWASTACWPSAASTARAAAAWARAARRCLRTSATSVRAPRPSCGQTSMSGWKPTARPAAASTAMPSSWARWVPNSRSPTVASSSAAAWPSAWAAAVTCRWAAACSARPPST